MKLYHGSTVVVETPNLNNLNYKTDFGKGFYTTTSLEQAKKWTKIKKQRIERLDNSNKVKRFVNVYEYTEDTNLQILNFPSATEEWLNFIFKNRQSEQLLHPYDVVKGPVANDNLYQVLVNYEAGAYNLEETIRRLKTYVLYDQISFHTEKSLNTIKYIETIEVGDEDE